MKIQMLAVSKAGHDKGRLYAVIREDASGYDLADGEKRTAARPKRKNRKHVQLIKHLPVEVTQILEHDDGPDDLVIKRAIRAYQKTSADQSVNHTSEETAAKEIKPGDKVPEEGTDPEEDILRALFQ